MSENTVTGNHADGDIAGGDITKIYNPANKTMFREMAEKIKEEYIENASFSGFMDRLNHYLTASTTKPLIGLEQKLRKANRIAQIPDALALKESFAKRLTKNQLSEQAQNFYCHILAHICTFFDFKIRPIVERSGTKEEIDNLVYELVLQIHADMCGTKLDCTPDDVRGMLFFLTGNCHIDWAR